MRKRLFDKKIKKLNLVTNIIDSPSVTATALTATTAGIDTVNASKAVNVSGLATAVNLTINTAFKLPTSPVHAASGLEATDYGTFYFSGLCLFVAKSGTWVSGSLGVG